MGKPTERGLVLVQIDGLSESQLQRALAEGHMPFLKSLIEERTCIALILFIRCLPAQHTSGPSRALLRCKNQPSRHSDFETTKAVAWSECLPTTSQLRWETKIRPGGNTGLLQGGSSYGNIYSGGADDVYFCATSFWLE